MTIQVTFGSPAAPSIKLLPPSGAVVSLTNGIGAVAPADVTIALAMGGSVSPSDPNWPAAQQYRMNVPAAGLGSWPQSGTITLPDGTTPTVTAGVVLIPRTFLNWAKQLGFTSANYYDGV